MSGESNPNGEEKPDKQSTEPVNQNSGFAFSAYRPSSEKSSGLTHSPAEPKSHRAQSNNTFKFIAIGTVAFTALASLWIVTHPPQAAKKEVIKVVQEEAPKVESPAEKYDECCKQIDDLLTETPVDNDSLYALAKERLDAALKIGEREKILKSADFAAATADGLRLPQDALKYYDMHILLDPDTKILEAKFRVCQRFGIQPNRSDENELYATRVQLVHTEDQLATNASYPLEEMDIYSKLLLEHEERVKQIKTYRNSRDKYADLLNQWDSKKKAITLMSQLSARQNNLPQDQDFSIDGEHAEAQLQQVNTLNELESSSAFSKFDWIQIPLNPGLKAFVSADVRSLVEVKLDPSDNQIESVRFISLPACLGEKFSKELFAVIPPMVYGKGADEIKRAGDILKAHMLATLNNGKTETANPVYLLVSNNLLAGFEVRHKKKSDWSKTPSIDQILSRLPKEKIPRRRYGSLSYSQTAE